MLALEMPPVYNKQNPFQFMELQDVQELTNFFREESLCISGWNRRISKL